MGAVGLLPVYSLGISFVGDIIPQVVYHHVNHLARLQEAKSVSDPGGESSVEVTYFKSGLRG